MTEIRRAILEATARCAIRLDDNGQQDDVEESHLFVRQVNDPRGAECGIRFQRCGGGRRVIRRKKGGE